MRASLASPSQTLRVSPMYFDATQWRGASHCIVVCRVIAEIRPGHRVLPRWCGYLPWPSLALWLVVQPGLAPRARAHCGRAAHPEVQTDCWPTLPRAMDTHHPKSRVVVPVVRVVVTGAAASPAPPRGRPAVAVTGWPIGVRPPALHRSIYGLTPLLPRQAPSSRPTCPTISVTWAYWPGVKHFRS